MDLKVKKVDQFQVYLNMVKAIEAGRYHEVKQADRILRKALRNTNARRPFGSFFCFSSEEAGLIEKLELLNDT